MSKPRYEGKCEINFITKDGTKLYCPDLGGGSIIRESCSSFYCSALIINHHPHFLLLLSFLLFVLSIRDKRGGYVSVHANETAHMRFYMFPRVMSIFLNVPLILQYWYSLKHIS